jgi:ATP-dependent DNA helicase RecQ
MARLDEARQVLARYFGYADFRAGQVDVVASVLEGHDTLGVLPTGGGKSLCYQVPALVVDGLTVVVSPLISLMKDQVDRLVARGIAATYVNSTLGGEEVTSRLRRAAAGELKLLYIAPERLEGESLQAALRQCPVALLAVDEAHCISEWGHEFRPSYRRIAAARSRFAVPQVVAVTATATSRVRNDIASQLEMRRPRVIVGGFDRPNLHYSVRECSDDDEKESALIQIMRSHERPAIVYASTRTTVERLARKLTRAGIPALPYHGGLQDDYRRDVQESFMSGGVDTIVATNAFGMGIDKPNVRLVAHFAIPGTLEAYYQEAGRAGRDGLPARCVLIHAYRDRSTHEWFINCAYPPRRDVEELYASLRASHRDGRISSGFASMDGAAMRFLKARRAVTDRKPKRWTFRLRLLATTDRIRSDVREDAGLKLLRHLWRHHGRTLYHGVTADLARLRSVPPEPRRQALERLRDRQFLDFHPLGGGTYLANPVKTLADFGINWAALSRRRDAELTKLDMMQAYAFTKNCRRANVLRYFGENVTNARCNACDNCQP